MKKFVSILLAAVFALSMMACGNAEGKVTAEVVEFELTSEQYAFGVDKTQPELLTDINSFIEKIKTDGTLDAICEKYFQGGEPTAVVSAKLNESKDQLVVATNAAFEPFEYMDGDKYYGIDMEIAALLAEELGKELVIQNMDFDAVCLSVGQQKCDVAMAGLTVNAEREEYVTFSTSYYEASQKLIVRSDDDTFAACKSAEDVLAILNGMTDKVSIGVQTGTTGQLFVEGDADWGFEKLPAKCVAYKNGSLAVRDMLNGNIGYVIIDAAPAASITEAMRDMNKIETFKRIFFEQGGSAKVLEGLKNTLVIAVLGLVIGIFIGILIATARVLPKYKVLPRILNGVCSFYVALFRGTPIVVQLLVCYYVLLPLIGIKFTSVQVAVMVFGLNSGAYISEIMRSGIQSVDPGQMEAGRAVGLSFGTSMVKIVIPQAVKNILPTLGNEFIALIKETSVVSFVGVTDLYFAFNSIGSNSYEFMVPYLVMAVIYIVLVLIISLFIKWMERSLKKSDRRN